MPTVIDSLQIEIQSGSSDASRGIDALAASLEKLRNSSKTTVVVKNLQNLSAAVRGFSDASKASSAMSTLASAIERLKSVGSVASIVNNLSKLPTALKNIESVDTGKMESQFRGIAGAAGELAGIKSGGLSSMVNALSKIDKVTKDLDDTKIAAFAERVKLLNEKLGPLSDKMATIKTGFGAINTGAGKAARAVDKFDHGIHTSTLNMASFIEVAQTAAQAITGLVQRFTEFLSQAIEWDGIAARFGRGFGSQAQETYEWIQRLNEEMHINVQQFMQYSSVYATMLTGFGVATEDAAKMALGYMELTYDIWAGYNDVYSSLEETAEAIKSAIAGEVEPVRRAGFTIVEANLQQMAEELQMEKEALRNEINNAVASGEFEQWKAQGVIAELTGKQAELNAMLSSVSDATLEQTAANHNLTFSLENATEAEKSYLRYLTMVDQAHAQGLVGTYAKELNTAEGMMRTFNQQLKSLAQAFGSLFLPVLTMVMPYFQAFVELLEEGVHALAAFFGVEIQKVDFSNIGAGADSMGDMVDNGSDLNKEIGNAVENAKELKNAMLGIDELNVISPAASSAGSGAGGGSGSGSGSGFGGWDVDSLWDESIFKDINDQVDSIKAKLEDWLPVIGGVATALAGLKLTKLLDDLEVAGFKLSNLGKVISVAGITVAVGKLVWDFTGAYLEGGDEMDLLKALGSTTIGTALAYWLAGKPGAAFTLAVSGVVTLSRLAVELKEGTVDWGDTETIVTALIGGFETVIGAVFTWKTIGPILKKLWPQIVSKATPILSKAGPYGWIATAAIAGISLAIVDYDFTDIGRTIGEKVGEALKAGFNFIKDGIVSAWKWAVDALEIDDLWDVLAVLFIPGEWQRRIAPEITEIFGKLSDWIEEKIENLKGNINEFFSGFFDGLFDGLGLDVSWAETFTDMFDIEYTDIIEMTMNPSTIGRHIITGITTAMGTTGIKDKLSSAWESAKTWWDKKPALSTYVPSIGKIWEKLRDAWTAAKDWWNEKRSSLSYTPSIGKIWEKLKSAWTSAKDWWNKSRSSLSYTPSIGKISTKLSDAWTTAKNWWNKSRSSLSYTPSIGSIKDKVISAWNSAKTWWKNNVGGLSTKLNISVPKISVKWATASAFGKEFRYPTGFNLVFAANGGIFDAGSLIWAGERGAEIVANAGGGKTGVMNVDQMQEAVYEGVLAAMTAVMGNRGGDGSQSVNVYLDSRQITSSVERRQHEKGASILGNEVFA